MILTDPYEIARFIKEAEKKTDVKAYVNLSELATFPNTFASFGTGLSYTLIGDYKHVEAWLSENQAIITDCFIENEARNSAIDLLDTKAISARIEPGAIIRDHVTIEENAVIMMGAIINIGAHIGSGTMIDMGAVLGARATVGKNSHVGAGAVLAGVLEPPSKQPVLVGDGVLIGANACILEGVRIGDGAVIGAGSVVTKDVEANQVVVGNPARVVKAVDEEVSTKTEILEDLR